MSSLKRLHQVLGRAARGATRARGLALGGKATDFATLEGYAQVTHRFTLALAEARVTARRGEPVRFCYMSGMGADPDETARFPWQLATRRLKGRTERDLGKLSETSPGFSAFAFGILELTSPPLVDRLLSLMTDRVDALAKAMIGVALKGHPHSPIFKT